MVRWPGIVLSQPRSPFQQISTAIFRMEENLHKAHPAIDSIPNNYTPRLDIWTHCGDHSEQFLHPCMMPS